METSKRMTYFNELAVNLNDEAFFSSEIFERSKDNPNPSTSYLCHPCNDSIDEYARRLSGKILSALRS